MQDTRLAAIMFTDIAGYSRLMEEDEVRTIAVLHEHNEVVFPLIEKASGTIVDAIGDGLLVTFPSVMAAVRCGVDIQNAVETRNRAKPASEHFHLRIGVHLGEIWEEGDRVFGTGVNVAARVQPFAEAGGLCVTEDVQRQIVNKIDLPVRSIGTKHLKNISRPVELFMIETGFETDNLKVPHPGASSTSSQVDAETIDEIKERILEEREKISAKRARGEGHSNLGQAIENRVFNVVERVMDAAVDKWEKLPPEKRHEALEHGNFKVRSPARGSGVDVRGGTTRPADDEDEEKPGSDLAIGAVFAGGFGAGYFIFGVGWMIWPFFVIGVLPLLSGAYKVVRSRIAATKARKDRPVRLDRQVLSAAKDLGGRVTVVQVASHCDLALDDAQQTLDRMAAKGYVSQEVLENGTVAYEFPSLT